MPKRQQLKVACACSTLRKASRAVSRHYEACLAQAGITATQFSLLRCLEREGPLPLSRMAETLVMERTSLYRSIAPLEAEKLVGLKDDPDDRRARVASLTDRGRKRIERVVPYWEEAQESFLTTAGPHWHSLSSALDELVGRLQGAEP